MPEAENKIEFGLSNVHYAKITGKGEDGSYTYGTVKPIPGAVTLTLSAQGGNDNFYADNIIFKVLFTNAGYTGDYTFANIPDDFRTEILKETKDSNGVYTENADIMPDEFAFMFQFEGDVKATKYVMYRCSCTRPNIEGDTKEDKTTPKTKKISITSMPREDTHDVQSHVSKGEAGYDDFFKSVYTKSAV